MVKTNSMFIKLGTSLPHAEMLNVNLNEYKKFDFSNLDERHLLIMFICAHCPFVKYVEPEISKMNEEILDTVQIIAVSSNDIDKYPSDSPENLNIQAKNNGWKFPYLYDKDQSFAKNLKAACTPDFYLFSNLGNKQFSLFYHGQLDDSRPSNEIPLSGKDLRSAIKALQNNQNYPEQQLPSLGCNIKWKYGNEPAWFNSNN